MDFANVGRSWHSAVEDHFSSGAPGVGFNFVVGNANVDNGFTSFEVATYDD